MSDSLRDTIQPKSDQLNADDLLTGPITVTVEGVRRSSSPDQPIDVIISEHRPYRPCKSMRRVMIAAWGDDGKRWEGQSMTLYCDPTVKFGGVAVGGIRISHITGIDEPLHVMLTTSRSKRATYVVNPLDVSAADNKATLPPYPSDRFDKNFDSWATGIAAGDYTKKTLIKNVSTQYELSAEQLARIESIGGNQ